MGRRLDPSELRTPLEAEWDKAVGLYLERQRPEVHAPFAEAAEMLFKSNTQSFREALLGCCLAKLAEPKVDLRLPYVTQGDDAFNAREIDEETVNPFLQQRQIPCSKGPYLAVFRRGVKFDTATRAGLRDKAGYDAFLTAIEFLQTASAADGRDALRYLLWKFVELREAAQVQLARVQRLSVRQDETLIVEMLEVPSGGLLPVYFAVAIFQTLTDCFKLGWQVEWQGINSADSAAGVGGVTSPFGATDRFVWPSKSPNVPSNATVS